MHPANMTQDDWDQLYSDIESNGEGQADAMMRYAYEAGWDAAQDAIKREKASG